MKSLFKYLKEYKKETVLSPVFKLLEAAFELLIPLVVARIIDVGIYSNDKAYIFKMITLMILLGVIGFSASVTGQYYAAKASAGFGTKIRDALFKKIQGMSYSDLDRIGTSTLINRLTSDTNQVQSGLNFFLRLLLRSPFIVLGSMVMTFTIDFKSAMIFAVTILILIITVLSLIFFGIPFYRKAQSSLDRVTQITRENLAGVRVIRGFCREEDEKKDFDETVGRLNVLQKIAGKISGLTNPAAYVVINTAIICIIHSGAVRINSGAMSQGQIIALYNYMMQMLVELIKLANLVVFISKSVACGNRISAVLSLDTGEQNNPSPLNAAVPDAPRVEFRHVSMKYADASDSSISDITFKAYPGETVGIIGGTGSGKTTLVNMIPRFYECSSGEVLIDGVNVNETDIRELREKCGMVPQKAVLFKGTIRENMKWGCPDATDEEIISALRQAQAEDVVKSKGGLDAEVEQYGRNFSGGQRQRLTIARALVRRPEILILDDSASALDYSTDAKLRIAVKNLDFRPTTFIVSQRTSSVMNSDKIIVLDDGDVAGIGTHEELYMNCPLYREIHDVQFGVKEDSLKNEEQ